MHDGTSLLINVKSRKLQWKKKYLLVVTSMARPVNDVGWASR